jgi:serine/threonine protein kinase
MTADNSPESLIFQGKMFGRYEVVKRIAVGGMAEIFLARDRGVQGVTRNVVLKCVLPAISSDRAFVELFHDEIRIAARLSHQNIAHVYDFGEDHGQYFIAMEYIDGAHVSQLIRGLYPNRMPQEHAIKITALVAEALYYAHTQTDGGGQPLGIIHRDVSPENVMVSLEGQVKLVDFGVAKASDQMHQTQVGVLRGKAAYLAPEQCMAKSLDHRVDIFALGTVLHEMLSGRRLFKRENDFKTMKAVCSAPIPLPSDLRPGVSRRLDDVILRALERDPDQRYQQADQLAMDLEHVLQEQQLLSSPIVLGRFVRGVLSSDGGDGASASVSGSNAAVGRDGEPSSSKSKPPLSGDGPGVGTESRDTRVDEGARPSPSEDETLEAPRVPWDDVSASVPGTHTVVERKIRKDKVSAAPAQVSSSSSRRDGTPSGGGRDEEPSGARDSVSSGAGDSWSGARASTTGSGPSMTVPLRPLPRPDATPTERPSRSSGPSGTVEADKPRTTPVGSLLNAPGEPRSSNDESSFTEANTSGSLPGATGASPAPAPSSEGEAAIGSLDSLPGDWSVDPGVANEPTQIKPMEFELSTGSQKVAAPKQPATPVPAAGPLQSLTDSQRKRLIWAMVGLATIIGTLALIYGGFALFWSPPGSSPFADEAGRDGLDVPGGKARGWVVDGVNAGEGSIEFDDLSGILTVLADEGDSVVLDDAVYAVEEARGGVAMAAGTHRVIVVRPDHKIWAREVELQPNRQVNLALKARPERPPAHWGRLTVDSEIPVQVFLWGKLVGQSPLTRVALRPGRHEILLVDDDQREKSYQIRVRRRREVRLAPSDEDFAAIMDLTAEPGTPDAQPSVDAAPAEVLPPTKGESRSRRGIPTARRRKHTSSAAARERRSAKTSGGSSESLSGLQEAQEKASRCLRRNQPGCCVEALRPFASRPEVAQRLVSCYDAIGATKAACALARRHPKCRPCAIFHANRCR